MLVPSVAQVLIRCTMRGLVEGLSMPCILAANLPGGGIAVLEAGPLFGFVPRRSIVTSRCQVNGAMRRCR